MLLVDESLVSDNAPYGVDSPLRSQVSWESWAQLPNGVHSWRDGSRTRVSETNASGDVVLWKLNHESRTIQLLPEAIIVYSIFDLNFNERLLSR